MTAPSSHSPLESKRASGSPRPANAQRPRVIGLVLASISTIGFLVGFWSPLMDGVDRRLPRRERVLELADPSQTMPVEVDPSARDSSDVREALQALPGPMVTFLRGFGGRVVIVKRAALINFDTEGELRDVVGVYVPAQRTAYVAFDAGGPGETALHEVGHMLDHALGELATQPAFTRIYESARLDTKVTARFRDLPKEFFAEFFATYYFSDRARGWVERRFPDAAAYLAELERSPLAVP